MKVIFYLKNYSAKKKSKIYLDFSYDGFRLQTTTGISIDPKNWNKKNGYPKSQIENYDVFREHLERIRNIVERFYLEVKSKGQIPHPSTIKKHLEPQLDQKTDVGDGKTDFIRHYEEYLDSKAIQNSHATIQILRRSLKELTEFSSLTKIELTFQNINRTFFEQYLKYLLEKENTNPNCLNSIGYVNDTIAKRMGCVKNYMKWAEERNYHNNTEYYIFKYKKAKKNEHIVLTISEFEKIKDFDLSNNKRLERVRDLFLFGIFTGQRWSDISSFNKKHLQGNVWKLSPKKTPTKIIEIPFVGFVKGGLKILEKYNYDLPKISGQKFNDYLKELGKLVGFDSEVILRRFSGKKQIELTFKKYELMSSHMARRTCVTLMLQDNIPPTTVMLLTGHSDLNMLLKYNHSSREVLEKSLIEREEHWNSAI